MGLSVSCLDVSLSGVLLTCARNNPCSTGFESSPHSSVDEPKETISYQRRQGKQRDSDCVTDKGLRFDDSVPIQTIHLSVPDEQTGLFDVIGEKITYRLAKRPSSQVILKYHPPRVKAQTGQRYYHDTGARCLVGRQLCRCEHGGRRVGR